MRGNLEKALTFVFEKEGVYSKDKNDPGGETKFGIARKFHMNIPKKKWDSLTIEDAREIYIDDYWNLLKCDDLPSPLDIAVCDTAVNPGQGRCRRMLRKCGGDWHVLLKLREDYYLSLKTKNPPLYELYIKGWINRVEDLKKLCKGMEVIETNE